MRPVGAGVHVDYSVVFHDEHGWFSVGVSKTSCCALSGPFYNCNLRLFLKPFSGLVCIIQTSVEYGRPWYMTVAL